MFFAILFVIAVLVALLSGGSLENLKNTKLKYAWLVFVSLAIKIALFSELRNAIGLHDKLVPLIYSFSLLLIVCFIIFNINLRGFGVLGLGLISNSLVITLNGGYMPVRAEYVPLIATVKDMERIQSGLPATNFIPISTDTSLSFLADIFLMPDWMPLSKVFSVGDVLIIIGGFMFVFYQSRIVSNDKK